MAPTPTVEVATTVSWDKITNAITGAMEGPYSPWIGEFKYDMDSSGTLAEAARNGEHTVWYNDPAFWTDGGKANARFDGPEDEEGSAASATVVSAAELIKGLQLMATGSPEHFADLVNESDDAITHDVFMQYVILGEVVFG
jgi:hypothetical protein